MSDDLCLIDSNVLVYAYDMSEGKKHLAAKNLLISCFEGKRKFAVSTQNLAEFFSIVTTKIKNPIKPALAKKVCETIINFSGFKVISYNQEILLQAMDFYTINKGHFWDTVLIATMMEFKIKKIITENVKDFKNYNSLVSVELF